MLVLFLNTSKGFHVLDLIIKENLHKIVFGVVSYDDKKTNDDSYTQIKKICAANKIRFYEKNDEYDFKCHYKLAIGWQFLIKDTLNLYIIHDSLLPKYRGFSPTVSALINGEKKIGATLIRASGEYDKGNIYKQEEILIKYPIRISEALSLLEPIYAKLTISFFNEIILNKTIVTSPQIEKNATYSLWRDDTDYFIDWSWSANKIRRFVDALAYPYNYAKTNLNNKIYTIEEVEVVKDVKIENRSFGKQIFSINKCPVIVCGKGLIKLTIVKNEEGKIEVFKHFRNNFY